MGYLSDVALVVNKDAYSRLMAIAAKDLQATRDIIEAIETKDYLEEGSMLFYWGATKWYENYDLPAIINDFICNESDHGDADYQFIRLGENADDVEIFGCCSHGLNINRSIVFY